MSSGNKFVLRLFFGFASTFVLTVLSGSAFGQSASALTQQSPSKAVLRVVTLDDKGNPISGVRVEVLKDGASVANTVSDQKGIAEFSNIAPGSYDVTVSKEGLQPDGISATITADKPAEVDFQLSQKAELKESITIKGQSDNPIEKGSSPATVIQPGQALATPIRPATVTDVLPLTPGVVRDPATGELKISGNDESRSALIVNLIDATDPATGQFGVTVPVDVVQSISVFQTPYLAEYGRFTAGVVSVETKRGGDKWHFELNDPLPDFRIFSAHLRGIRDATPRVDFSGPIVPGKLYFSEGLEYALNKRPVKGLAFPRDESKTESVNSFTQIDYLISAKNTLTGTFHLAPWHANFLNLDPFNPQPVTPSFSAHDYSGSITERAQIGSSLLESILGIKRFTGNVWAQGNEDMILTPTGNSGNYFSQQDRKASRTEWMEIFSPAPIGVKGKHNLKIGSVITRTTNRGDFTARPVDILDNQGDLIKRIEFVNGSPFNRRDLETTFFAEDHYIITPNLSLDIGLRFERQGITETMKLAPRAGIAWAPKGPNSTIIRGGFGLFYDRVPLDVYSFASYPEQLVTTFAPDGTILTGPTLFANITDRALRSGNPFVRSGDTVGNFAPYSSTWNVEVDQPVNHMLRIKTSYLQSNSSGVVIFTPEMVDGRNALVLGGGGRSTYRQFEIVGRLKISEDREMFFSYVHSRAQGDVNQFNNYLGNFPFPVIRTDVYSNLSGDLPNRFLAWGVIHLPWKMRVSPLVEYRNGFPYAKVDAAQNFVGIPYTTRYPNFYSFDARVSKDLKVSDKYTLRLSVSGYNVTNHFNPSAVFSNIAAPQFGTFFGDYKRHLTADFDVIF